MTKRLRISHVIVQPVLVWDNGEDLAPGPPAQPQHFSVAELPGLPERLRESLATIETQQDQTAEEMPKWDPPKG